MKKRSNKSPSGSSESTDYNCNNLSLSTPDSLNSSSSQHRRKVGYVKVFLQGDLIGRSLDLLALDGQQNLIEVLQSKFKTNIKLQHVTYSCHDAEGIWINVSGADWQDFVRTAKYLNIDRPK